jgi:Ser/Thr protein kinase RdoA (MazF antagonist)
VVTALHLDSTVRTMWHRRIEDRTALGACVWRLRLAGDPPGTVVAKWVPDAGRDRLLGGLAAAARLARGCSAALPTGVAIRAVNGATWAPLYGGALVLLADVPGRALEPADPVEAQLWGDALGRLHRDLAGFADPRLPRLGRPDPAGVHLRVAPWLPDAVAEADAALVRLTVTDRLSYGVLHGDPDPGAFRLDRATGRIGVVGWGWAATGLLLSDVAAAVCRLGGSLRTGGFLAGYLAAAPLTVGELTAGLAVLLRCRLAGRAADLARRLHAGDSPDAAADLSRLAGIRAELAAVAAC